MENRNVKTVKGLLSKESASLLLFLLWPFMGFLLALRNFHQKSSRVVVLMFFVVYGFTIVSDRIGSDLYANLNTFKLYVFEPDSFLITLLTGLFQENGTLDIIQKLIVFFVSRLTDDARYLFAVYALILGFVYLKGTTLLYKSYLNNKNPNSWIMLFFMTLIVPITSIGNFRFFSAIWIFFIGAYLVIYSKKYIYLLLCFVSVLMHFGLLAANLLLIAYLLIGNRKYIYLVFLIISFLVSQFAGDYILQLASGLGGNFELKANAYLNEDYIEALQQREYAWFMTLLPKLILYFIYIMFAFSYYLWPKVRNEGANNLFFFSLVLLIFTNFVIDVPSLGKRYAMIFELFAFAYLIFSTGYKYGSIRKIKLPFYLGIIPLLLHFVFTLRTGSETINAWLFLPTPLPFMGDPISLWTYISGQ